MLIRKIYEDNVIGRLPDRLFQSMLTDYENEQNELNKIIETDTADMQRIIGGQNNVERFLKMVKKYENITELTPAMINEFIDKILVHEPQGKGADRTTEVEISGKTGLYSFQAKGATGSTGAKVGRTHDED